MDLVINDRASLRSARGQFDADTVTIDTQRLKYRNLLPCAAKYALWAARPGGRIIVVDAGGRNAAPPPYEISFNLVCQWLFKFIGADCRLVSLEPGRLELERVLPQMEPGWSAGVVFSGNDAEIPTLLRCLDGLVAQPELGPSQQGEIIVCGPDRETAFLARYPGVRYLVFDTPPGPRFLIGRKKNALMAAMKAPRMAVLHARIVLDDGALGHVPREFDISGPLTRVSARHGGEQPYLSMMQTDAVWSGLMTKRATRMLGEVAGADYLALMERGPVFVDGGAFYVSRRVFEACALHDQIAWEEAEDAEWCGRAFASGLLVDLAPGSGAVSQTSKLSDRSAFGALEAPARRTLAALKAAEGGCRHLLMRGLGRR